MTGDDDEIRQEVAPVKEFAMTEPVSALPAAWAPVPAARRMRLAAAGTPKLPQVQWARHHALCTVDSYGINGTTGLPAQDIPASTVVGDVRGVPPRGRPV